jgi:hypothetical protein
MYNLFMTKRGKLAKGNLSDVSDRRRRLVYIKTIKSARIRTMLVNY